MGMFTLHNSRLVRTVVISTALLAGSVTGFATIGVTGAGATMSSVDGGVVGLAGVELEADDMLTPCGEIEVVWESGGATSGDGTFPRSMRAPSA